RTQRAGELQRGGRQWAWFRRLGGGRRDRLRYRSRIEQDAEELDAAHAVDHRVMHLAEDDALLAVPAVDLVQLPERTLAMERLREEPADQVHELVMVAGRAQRVAEHVMPDVEVGIGLPRRMREIEWHGHRALGVAGNE